MNKKEVANFNSKSFSIIEDRLWRFVDFLDKKIDEELQREPLSQSDSIAKCSYSLALERDKNALINILNGREFHDMGE